jgi:hypothetical protein
VQHAHQSHCPCFDHCNNIWWRAKSLSSSYATLSIILLLPSYQYPTMFLSTLFSITPRLCSALDVRQQVSHPYKVIDKIIVLYLSYNL